MVDPRNPRIVYAASPGAPLYKSEDGGATWSPQDGSPRTLWALVIDPSRPRTLYAGSVEGGPFKSTDGGASWVRVRRGLPATPAFEVIAVDPRQPKTLFAANEFTLGALFKSTDGGATWRPSARGLGRQSIRAIAFDPGDGFVYALTRVGGVYRSTNGGAAWRPAGEGLEVTFVRAVAATGSGLLAGTHGHGVFASADRAVSWQPSSRGLSALRSAGLAADGQAPPRLYSGNDVVGLFKSADRGAHWLRLSTPYPYAGPVEIDPRDPQAVYAGLFDAVARSDNGGRRWPVAFGLPCQRPARIVVDPGAPDTIYVSSFLYIGCGSNPGGCHGFRFSSTGSTCLRDQAAGQAGVQVLAAAPHPPFHLYAVTQTGLFRSADQGDSWALLAPGVVPHALAFDPLEAGVVYGGFANAVGRSADGGATWELHGEGLPARGFLTALAVDPADPSTVYAAFFHEGLFESTDAGVTWSELVDPEVSVLGIVLDLADPSTLYLATDGASVLMVETNE